MKVLVAVSLCVLAVFSASYFFRCTSSRRPVPLQVAQAYSRWLQEHGRLYATPTERDYRLTVFYDQWIFVEQSNKEYEQFAAAAGQTLTGPMFAINGMSDLTTEEFKVRYAGTLLPEEIEVTDEEPTEVEAQAAPESQNLAASNLLAGYSIKIRNQGDCGSCWAFSAVAALEKFYFDKSKTQVDFSQQELVDCDKGSGGCKGGESRAAIAYAAKNGLSLASQYPYKGSTGACKKPSSPTKIGNPESNYLAFSQKKAVSLSGKAHASMGVYSSGKFRNLSNSKDVLDLKSTGECSKTIDHSINLASASGDTIRIFNSWGTGWGEGGYKSLKTCAENNLWGSGNNYLLTV